VFEKQTPYEIFVVARMRAIVASGTSNTELLASAFEVMVNSDFLKDNEKLRLIEGMAGTYFNEKKYDLAISWGKRYLEKDNSSPQIHNMVHVRTISKAILPTQFRN